MMRNVCATCGVEMHPKKNDVCAVLMQADNETIDVVCRADLWACPCCDNEILTGFGVHSVINMGHNECEEYLKDVDEEDIIRYGRNKPYGNHSTKENI